MLQENSLIQEIRQRLDHIRSMPETPSRLREMHALERALEETLKMPPCKMPGERTARRQRKLIETPETDDEPPRRIVKHVEGRRKVIIAAPRREDQENDLEAAMEKRAREHWKRDIRSTLGNAFQGMS